MDPNTLAFAGVALVISVVPGPDMALVTRNTLLGGRRIGVATVAGIAAGIAGWSVLAAVGVAAILAASATLFGVVKLLGAGYLVYLGVVTLRSGTNGTRELAGRAPMARRTAAVQGFLSAALNPKLGVLFLTLLPQFAGPDTSPFRALQLAALFAAIGLSWLLVFTTIVDRVGRALSRPGPQRALRWLSGGLLVGLGARVALERA